MGTILNKILQCKDYPLLELQFHGNIQSIKNKQSGKKDMLFIL